MIKKTLPVVLLVLAVPASAGVTSVGPSAVRTGASSFVVQYASNGTPLAVGARSITAGATSGQALVRDMFNAAGPVGNLPLTVSRTVTSAGIASSLARAAFRASVPISVGMALYDLYKGAGVRTGANGIEIDPGTASVLVDDLTYQVSSGPIASLMSQACSAYANTFKSVTSGYRDGKLVWENYIITSSVSPLNAGYMCSVYLTDPFTAAVNRHRYEPVVTYKNQKPSCGTGEVRLDGLCETGSYKPTTETEVAAALNKVTDKSSAVSLLPRLIDAGIEVDSSPLSVSGPQSQVSSPSVSTKTSPAGTVTATTTNNYQYSYSGDTINYTVNQTTITNTTLPDGTKTTQTETSDKTPEKTNCELYPDSIGCMKLGEPGETKIPESKKNIDISPEGVSLPSGCPSDLALPGGRVVSYASACDAAQKMRPLVIAAGVFSALLIAVAAIRGNG